MKAPAKEKSIFGMMLTGVYVIAVPIVLAAMVGIGAEAAQTGQQSANMDKNTFKKPKIRARPCPAVRHDAWHQVTPTERGSCPERKK
jgi:hypothetical protein